MVDSVVTSGGINNVDFAEGVINKNKTTDLDEFGEAASVDLMADTDTVMNYDV